MSGDTIRWGDIHIFQRNTLTDLRIPSGSVSMALGVQLVLVSRLARTIIYGVSSLERGEEMLHSLEARKEEPD